MTRILFFKLLRDCRTGLIIVAVLLLLFQLLWARISERVAGSGQILDSFRQRGVPVDMIRENIFKGPGEIIQAIMGGEGIMIERPFHMISIGYVHPLVQTILCIWAIGRAAGAIAGEIDRGTMELLLAQPIRRSQVIVAHLCVDLATIPVLCLSMWAGTWIGVTLVGFKENVDVAAFGPALISVAALVFAVGGLTMWLSSAGRFRWRVLGLAVLLALVQFLVNLVGQLWDPATPLRPCTLFYYYQPQPMILQPDWYAQGVVWLRLAVLVGLGTLGYAAAMVTFCRRDLPAPL